MQLNICVFGGSNPSRENGYSFGRVHKPFGRTCNVRGSTPHSFHTLIPTSGGQSCFPVDVPFPGKHAGAPVRLLPGCRGYRKENRGNSRWEKEDNPLPSHPVLPSGHLLNRHSAACWTKKGDRYCKKMYLIGGNVI